MKIITLPVGPIQANCYIVYDEKTKETVIIDPGAEGSRIMDVVKKENLQVKMIVNTHGHSDHIGADKYVREATGAAVAIHELDAPMLVSARENLSLYLGEKVEQPAADLLLHDGDCIGSGEVQFTVIHTPGHTRGGICLLFAEALFSGDTLFAESIGRTDFPGGSMNDLLKGVKTKLFTLDDSLVVYPGHGSSTTIGWEKNHNPYLA